MQVTINKCLLPDDLWECARRLCPTNVSPIRWVGLILFFFFFESGTTIIQLQHGVQCRVLCLIPLKLLPLSFENRTLHNSSPVMMNYALLSVWCLLIEREKEKKERQKERRRNLAENCIGFVKSCHFSVTSRVAHLVFSWCRMITHRLSSSLR